MPTVWTDYLDSGPGGTLWPLIDPADIATEALPALHAASMADLVWFTEADLAEWIEEGMRRLAELSSVWVTRATTAIAAGQQAFDTPAGHVSTGNVTWDEWALRPASTIELEGLDPDYRYTPGPPRYWYADLTGMNAIALYPVPDEAGELALVYAAWEPDLPGSGVDAPSPVRAYLRYFLLGEAFGREGEFEAPDIAAHCRGRLDLFNQIFQQYYGKSTSGK